jgi:ABC-type Fe3+ transport system permease subunit
VCLFVVVCACVCLCVVVCGCLCVLFWLRQITRNHVKSRIGTRGNQGKSGIPDFSDSPGSRVSFCVFVCACVCLCVLVCVLVCACCVCFFGQGKLHEINENQGL